MIGSNIFPGHTISWRNDHKAPPLLVSTTVGHGGLISSVRQDTPLKVGVGVTGKFEHTVRVGVGATGKLEHTVTCLTILSILIFLALLVQAPSFLLFADL